MIQSSRNLKPAPTTLTKCKQTIYEITSHFMAGETARWHIHWQHDLTYRHFSSFFNLTFLSIPWGNLTNPQNHSHINAYLSTYLTMFVIWTPLILCLTEHFKTTVFMYCVSCLESQHAGIFSTSTPRVLRGHVPEAVQRLITWSAVSRFCHCSQTTLGLALLGQKQTWWMCYDISVTHGSTLSCAAVVLMRTTPSGLQPHFIHTQLILNHACDNTFFNLRY